MLSLVFLLLQDPIAEIKDYYMYVNSNEASFSTVNGKVNANTSEEADVLTYLHEGKPVKVRIEFSGETGKLVSEYYIKDGQLLYASDQQHTYNRPVSMDSTKAAALGSSEWHDPTKSIVLKDQFFFWNGKLIKWVDSQDIPHEGGDNEWMKKERYYLGEYLKKEEH